MRAAKKNRAQELAHFAKTLSAIFLQHQPQSAVVAVERLAEAASALGDPHGASIKNRGIFMLKRLYDTSKIWFALAWILAYCVLMSVGDALSDTVGIPKLFSVAVGLVLSAALLGFLKKYDLFKSYGLCRAEAPARDMLYYVPLLVLLTANFWNGVTFNESVSATVLYILSMLCVGFLEEVIFRGLLFEAMRENSPRAAVVVSSVTFGMGHIINLVNGSGAELLPNLLQVIYATAAGFLFVMIYCRTKSLVVCIVTHGLFNAFSVFAVDAKTTSGYLLSCLFLTLISGLYAIYLGVQKKTK